MNIKQVVIPLYSLASNILFFKPLLSVPLRLCVRKIIPSFTNAMIPI
jgi:hypothetical protein